MQGFPTNDKTKPPLGVRLFVAFVLTPVIIGALYMWVWDTTLTEAWQETVQLFGAIFN